MEAGQAVDEPGLLLPDGDPGIVLLGVNKSGLGTLNIEIVRKCRHQKQVDGRDSRI